MSNFLYSYTVIFLTLVIAFLCWIVIRLQAKSNKVYLNLISLYRNRESLLFNRYMHAMDKEHQIPLPDQEIVGDLPTGVFDGLSDKEERELEENG